MTESVKVKLYLLLRRANRGPNLTLPEAKQWALLIEYYERYQQEVDSKETLETFQNDEGFLEVTVKNYSKLRQKEWESAEGYEMKDLQKGKEIDVEFHELPGLDYAEEYAKMYTKKETKFHLFDNNGQTFVQEFLASAALDNIELPTNAHTSAMNLGKVATKATLLRTSQQLAYTGFKQLALKLPEKYPKLMEIILKNEFGLDVKGVTKGLIKRVFPSCGSKMLERISSGLMGASSPWQLLQIPAEIVGYSIAKWMGKDDNAAWWYGKYSSLATTVGVGAAVGAATVGVGAGASVVLGAAAVRGIASAALWAIGEVTSWLVSTLITWMFPKVQINFNKFCSVVGQFLATSFLNGFEWISGSVKSITTWVKATKCRICGTFCAYKKYLKFE